MNCRQITATLFVLTALSSATQIALAQWRRPSVVLPIVIGDGAHTAPGDILRGQGAYLEGQGAYLQGLGAFQAGFGQRMESFGRYQVSYQQACLVAEDLKQKSIQTYEQKYQLARRISEQKAQDQALAQHQKRLDQLSEMRDRPTTLAVQSGVAANFLLNELGTKAQSVNVRGLGLTPEQLSNVKLQTSSGLNLGLFTTLFDEQGKVHWPISMQDRELESAQKPVEATLGRMLRQLSEGCSVDKASVGALRQDLDRLIAKAQQRNFKAKNMSGATEARLFCTALSTTVKHLGESDAVQLRDSTLNFQARTTAEMMDYITQHNLRFAPTDADGTVTYSKLHECLAATHRQLGDAAVASR